MENLELMISARLLVRKLLVNRARRCGTPTEKTMKKEHLQTLHMDGRSGGPATGLARGDGSSEVRFGWFGDWKAPRQAVFFLPLNLCLC